MKIYIELPADAKPEQVLHLKKFLESTAKKELKSIEIERLPAKPGEMSGGVMGSLTALLIGIAGPFSRLAEAFSKYSSSFRTELILKNEYGDELILNTKRVDKEGIRELVQQFLEKSKPKTTSATRKTRTKA